MKHSVFRWSRLDNAAKIFPSTTTRTDTKVFRFACELTEPVDPKLLQSALDSTLELFPFYHCTLRRGLFWYFFTQCNQQAVVEEENQPLCNSLYDPDKHQLLFSVTYFQNRINLEIYHSLADGTGALSFLRMLIFYYLTEKHPELKQQKIDMEYDASLFERMDDSFSKYYSGKKKYPKQPTPKAYRFSGRKIPEKRILVIEGTGSASQILEKAHEYQTTMSMFLCAVLLKAIAEQMTLKDKKNPVNLSVPVNLRNFFQSKSARNFFSVINISYDFKGEEDTLPAIIASVADSFRRELTQEKISGRINELCALEHNILTRLVPLPIKDISLWAANRMSERSVTASFSNIGKIHMPQELSPYIRLFSVFASTRRLQICLCSFGDLLTMSFSSVFVNTEVQRRFFRILSDMGIELTISANETGTERRDS